MKTEYPAARENARKDERTAEAPRLRQNKLRYAKAMGKLDKSDAYLQGALDEEGKAMLKNFEDAQSEVSDIGVREAFIDGFRLGAKFMLAVLSEDDGELRPLI